MRIRFHSEFRDEGFLMFWFIIGTFIVRIRRFQSIWLRKIEKHACFKPEDEPKEC